MHNAIRTVSCSRVRLCGYPFKLSTGFDANNISKWRRGSTWWVHCLVCTDTGAESDILPGELGNNSCKSAQLRLELNFEGQVETRDADLQHRFPIMTRDRKNLTLSFPHQIATLLQPRNLYCCEGSIYILPLCQKYVHLSVMMNQNYGMEWNTMAEEIWWEYSLSDHIYCLGHPSKNLETNV